MERVLEPEWMDDAEEARAYAETDFARVNQAFAERLLELAGGVDHPRVVDLGVGPGDIPLRVGRARPDWDITGLDASAAMLGFACEATRNTAMASPPGWVLADAKAVPFPDAAFDIVCSNSILHHLPEPQPLWAEVRRIAKHGALVFFRDLLRPETPEAAHLLVEKHAGDASELLKEEFCRSLLAAFTPAEVRSQLDAGGLGSLSVAQVTDRHLDAWGHID